MKHSFIDKYSSLESPIHRISSSFKFTFAFTFLITVLLLPLDKIEFSGIIIAFVFLMVFSAILASRVPISFVLKRSAVILPFSVFIMMTNFILCGGKLEILLMFFLKSYISILIIILLVSTTSFASIISVLSRIHLPRVFIIAFSFMYRYFFVLIDELEKMLRAVKLRSCGIKRRRLLMTYVHIIGILFIRSYERAERVYKAMVLRGFDGKSDNL
ncbi:MAG: hypothetical protein KAS64_04755 [Spirochaetes bacterium]|nr:hypothetical protein [Spirochaetota bacterium]